MSFLDFKFAVVRGLNKLLGDDNLGGFRFYLSLTEGVQLRCDSGAMTLRGAAEESVSAFIDRMREAHVDQTAAHVALGYTGITFSNGRSPEARDAEAERLTVASAVSPGGVAAWSTGQSAVSAGGSLGPSVLACDYLDPYASHRHLQRMSERGPGIAATIRKDHVKVLRREMDRKLVVMSGLDDTWSGEKL